ncbi:hypothetical protein [Rhodopirellula sallentina]|uniref:AMP-dependent synthetase/ligase domain-containing protein n=1 Tax=Rhodopirellula sallentina SM41 TaxID=1263870 RepID=M5U377_9BACT|nr:hypothetical protein [Rhodopirellula sallentina]EMI55910.1 hypothetical protein RSSM_02650 [Rhodopirellula sallentina SM41]
MIRPTTIRFELGTCELSYAAGSTSLSPEGFRVLGQSDGQRMTQLVRTFPELANWFHERSLIVSAYPAALGLQGVAPFVDTYLHPPTFIRAMRLAALDFRPVVMAGQPLVGAEMLLQTIEAGLEIPDEILWAVGGYYMPRSLETFISDELAKCGSRLEVLHCYGVAEIGHTCFAAMSRFDSGEPRYQLVADDVFSSVHRENGCLELRRGDRNVVTEDLAEVVGGEWKIRSGPRRMCPAVLRDLESWSSEDWRRRTGYLHAEQSEVTYQLRRSAGTQHDAGELPYYRFLEAYGGAMQSKPKWHRQVTMPRTTSNPSQPSVAVA